MVILSTSRKIFLGETMRVKAVIAYDGSHYFGFQKQKSTTQTITYAIEKALYSLGIKNDITGSGRTDAKVHASGQVIHFDVPIFWHDLKKLKQTLNQKLTDISFKHITQVDTLFHARFSAKQRIYRYIFKTSSLSVFEKKYISSYQVFNALLLKEALKVFEGEHDFDYFRKQGTVTHTSIRTIYTTTYRKRGNYHFIYFTSNGFLRAQIRMMVAVVMAYAQNKMTLNEIKQQLACQKKISTSLAPPEGLYLAKILY